MWRFISPLVCIYMGTFLVGLVSVWTAAYLATSGYLRTVSNHSPGPCSLVSGVEHGSEGIAVLHDGLALITSGLTLRGMDWGWRGRILSYDMSSPSGGATEVTIEGALDQENFSPHGIGIWQDENSGDANVFIVNHPKNAKLDTVEKFYWHSKRRVLEHQQTIADDQFRNLNDVAPLSSDSFYVTNSAKYNGIMGLVEFFAMARWGSILYSDGSQSRVVVTSLAMPNGIVVSSNGSLVYVAASRSDEIIIYNRLGDTGLRERMRYGLGTAPDNLYVDPNSGDLWIGAAPKAHLFVMHFVDPHNNPAPAQALRVSTRDGLPYETEEVFAESEGRIYGTSSAVYYQSKMLIGTIQHKLLSCEIRHIGI